MKNKNILWSMLITFVSLLVITIAGILYTGHVLNENNRIWCDSLIAIDDAYAQAQANTVNQSAKRIGNEFHKLRVRFEC